MTIGDYWFDYGRETHRGPAQNEDKRMMEGNRFQRNLEGVGNLTYQNHKEFCFRISLIQLCKGCTLNFDGWVPGRIIGCLWYL